MSKKKRKKGLAFIASGASGSSDISVNHDKYLTYSIIDFNLNLNLNSKLDPKLQTEIKIKLEV